MAPASLLLARLRVRSSWATSLYVIGRNQRHLCRLRSLSSSAQPVPQLEPEGTPLSSDPKAGLSARMSFVFDQIDAMDRMRGAKDDALEKIRAWRQSKKQQEQDHDAINVADNSRSTVASEERETVLQEERENVFKKEIELVHPWPEWIEFMERLVNQNYFDHRRFDEDQIVKNLPIDLPAVADDLAFDFTRDWTTVRTACLNFGRDRFDILRSLSKKDLQILVGHGCPSTDRKVVFSAKLLRKLVRLDEGDVCSSCKLRTNCSNGFLLSQKEDEARTIDVIRILLAFGFDPINPLVENKSLMEIKTLKKTVRKLLHDVTILSGVPIDPNLPPPVIKKPPPKVKQPPPPPKRRVGRDDVEMKKGDWISAKCDFMNFAKNNICLQCDAKRPKRQLLPGEWECPQCNFLNYRRNMACFRCDHRRPPEELTEAEAHFPQPGPRAPRADKFTGLSSQAWNFDFDDNESDGADVAAFEFADPPRTSRNPLDNKGVEYSPLDDRSGGRFASDVSRAGFNDFHDEDDDVDSYEIDDRPISEGMAKFGGSRTSADHDSNDDDNGFDDDDDGDDDELLNRPEKGRSAFGPGEEIQGKCDFSSDKRGNQGRISRRGSGQRGSYDSDNESLSGSDSEDDDLSLTRMDEVHGRGRSRPSGFRQLNDDDDDHDDDDDDDDDAQLPQRDVYRGRNRGMNDGMRRERFNHQATNGRGNEFQERGRNRPSGFSQLDDDDDDDTHGPHLDVGTRRNKVMNEGLRRERFDHRAMSRPDNEIYGRGHRRPSNFGQLDDDDDDDDSHHRARHDGGRERDMRMRDGSRRERLDNRAMNGRGNGINGRGSRPSNYGHLDDDDGDNYQARRNAGGGRNMGMKDGFSRERFDNRAFNGSGSDRMKYRKGVRDNQSRERSRGGFNDRSRGRGGRSDRSNAGSRSHNEFGRGGRSNRWDDGPKRF